MTVAVAMTVRNEETLLRSNLLYHHFLGVDHFFVYADRCEDGTIASISDLPFVEVLPMTAPETLKNRDGASRLLNRIRAQPNRFTLRLTLNAFHATIEARRRGCKWLLHIDADELVSIDPHKSRPGMIRECLESVDPRIEVVRFRNCEVCQRNAEHCNVFAEETLFKTPDPRHFKSRLSRIIARLSRFGDHRARDRTTRKIYDPFAGRNVDVAWFYGHWRGKAAARLSADVFPGNCHDFERRNGQKPREEVKDYLLHYFAYSFENFIARCRMRKHLPAANSKGALPKRLFIDVVNRSGYSEDELREFYERWVRFDAKEIEEHLNVADPAGPKIVEITGPKATFALLNGRDASGLGALPRVA